jgi:hypothetical protein
MGGAEQTQTSSKWDDLSLSVFMLLNSMEIKYLRSEEV